MSSASRRRRIAFAAIALLLGTVVALAAAEGVARLFHFGPRVFVVKDAVRLSQDPDLVYELVPGERTPKSGKTDDTPINAAGFRGPDYPETTPPGTFRIAIVGDSVAFGVWVPREDTMAAVLEQLLNSLPHGDRPRFEVLNFGVSGYNSRQIARRTETLVTRFRPDIVLYLYCLNDPEDPGDVSHLLEDLSVKDRRAFEAVRWRADSVLAGSRLYQLLMIARDAIGKSGPGASPLAPFADEIGFYSVLHADGPRWNRVKGDIARVARAADAMTASLVGVISPHMWEDGNPARLTVQPPLSTIAAKVGAEFRGVGASVLDLAWPVAKYSAATGAYLGLDPVHFTPEGHRFAALAILKHLAGEGLLPGIGADAVANLASQRDDLRRMAAALQ